MKNILVLLTVSLFHVGCSLEAQLTDYLNRHVVVALSSPSGTQTNLSVIPVKVVFSEKIEELTPQDFSVTNATIISITGDGQNFTAELAPTSDGVITLHYLPQEIGVENSKRVSGEVVITVLVDRNQPDVTLTAITNTLTDNPLIRVSLNFSENMNPPLASDFSLSGAGAIITSLVGDGQSYTLELLAVTPGVIELSLPENKIFDRAGNGNKASNQIAITYDPHVPVPVLTSTSPLINNLGSIPITIQFNSAVTGLIAADFTVTNGTVTNLVGSGSTYTAQLSPTSDGTVTITLPENSVANFLASQNLRSNTLQFHSDTVRPTLTLSNPTPTTGTAASEFSWNVNYSGASAVNLSPSDVSLSGATTGCIVQTSGSGVTTRTIQVTGCTGNGNLSIAVGAGTASDDAGNMSLASGSSNPTVIDNTGPSLVIGSPNISAANSSASIVWPITYSGANVVDLTASDITFSGTATAGCVASISGSGALARTVSVSGCTGNGGLSISINAGSARDALGNLSAGAGPSLPVTIDNISPTLAAGAAVPAVGNRYSTFTWPVVISGASQVSLSNSDIIISGPGSAGCSATVTGTGLINRNIELSGCTGGGTLDVRIAPGAALDAVGNQSAQVILGSATVDNSVLSVGMTSAATPVTNVSSIPVSVLFSTAVADFDASDLTVANATVSGFSGSGANYSFNLIPAADGLVRVQINAGRAHDAAMNANVSSNILELTVDRVVPTLSISAPSPALGNAGTSFVFSLTFTGANAVNLDNADIVLAGTATAGCGAQVSGSGTTSRTVSVTGCTGNGVLNISIPAGSASDLAGNSSLAVGPSGNVVVDNLAPSISLSAPSVASGNSSTDFVFTVNYTNADSVTLSNSDIAINGTASSGCVATVAGTGSATRTVTVRNCSGNGTMNISIAAQTASDSAGNKAGAVGPSSNVSVDNTAPTVQIATVAPASGNSATDFIFTVSYAGASSISLAPADVSFHGAATGCSATVSGSGLSARTITVSGCSGNGVMHLSIAGGSAQDPVGNSPAGLSSSPSVVIDNIGPDISIAGPAPAIGNSSSSFVWTVNYTGAASVSLSTVSLTGASAGCVASITGSGASSRTVTVQNCTGTGTFGFTIPTGSAADAVGNLAGPASVSATIDNTAPTISVLGPLPSSGNSSSTFEWTLSYVGANSISLANSHVQLTGAVAGCVKNTSVVDANTRKISVTGCTGNGSLNLSVAASTAQDSVGNSALAVGATTVLLDNNPPTLSLSAPSTSGSGLSSIYSWTVSYSGATAISLNPADITLSGSATTGCSAQVTGSGVSSRTVSVSGCTGTGTLAISVAAGSAEDEFGNQSLGAGPSASASMDNSAPTIAISNPSFSHISVGGSVSWTVTYTGAASISLANAHINLSGTTTGCSAVVTGSGLSQRTVTVSGCTSQGSLGFSIANGTAVSSTGSPSAASSAAPNAVISQDVSVSLSTLSDSVYEGSGTNVQNFMLQISPASPVDIVVNYVLPAQFTTATSHNLTSGSVTIPAGSTSWPISYQYYGNSTANGAKSIHLALTSITTPGAALGISTGTTTTSRMIIDEESPVYRSISLSSRHGCSVNTGGVLKCWGLNTNSQVGDGSTVLRPDPVVIDSGVSYTRVATSAEHSCGITSTGLLKCWGLNTSYRLGDGTVTTRTTPVPIDSATAYSQVSLANTFGCGLTVAGALKCWGNTPEGSRQTPTVVDSGVSYSAISLASSSACGITTTGVLKCWGDNSLGQVGDSTTTARPTPVVVDSGVAYAKISLGGGSACGITNSGVLKCWGYNSQGRLGNGNSVNATTPQVIDSGTLYSYVGLSSKGTCGTTTSNVVKCWGPNADGELGFGDNVARAFPTALSLNDHFVEFVGSGTITCGRTSRGVMMCSGNDKTVYAGLGASYAIMATPITVENGISFSKIAQGIYQHGCRISILGELSCSGSNTNGELGIGDKTNRTTLVNVDPGEKYSVLSLGAWHTCAITTHGVLKCWGNNAFGKLGDGSLLETISPKVIDPGTLYKDVSAASDFTCGITTGNKLKCWGNNAASQLGVGDTVTRQTPTSVDATESYQKVAAGRTHACALTTAGKIKCWGQGSANGSGSATAVPVPQIIDAAYNFVNVASGNGSCGVTTTGILRCWGPLPGDGTTEKFTPVTVDSGVSYAATSFGPNNRCGLTTSGVVKCWGIGNQYGEIGNGVLGVTVSAPQIIDSGYSFTQISAGGKNVCGMTSGGLLRCWGTMQGMGLGEAPLWQFTLGPAP